MTNHPTMEIIKSDISICLPVSSAELPPESTVAISRKWLDGGKAFFELVHPEFKAPLWLSVMWFAEYGGKKYLVADEADRTKDPEYLRQHLVELENFNTIKTLGDEEFVRLLPHIKAIVNGSTALEASQWRQQYANDVTRYFNII